jgi:hypothetical protein
MITLLDLFYIYNKKRPTALITPDDLLNSCQLFENLNLEAKVVTYPNNVKVVESSIFHL